MQKPITMFPGKVPASDELHTIMEMLANLDMAADTAERLVDYIVTLAEHRRLATDVTCFVDSDSSASASPTLESVSDSSELISSSLALDSSHASATTATLQVHASDITQSSDVSPLTPSIHAMHAAVEAMQTALDGAMAVMSLTPTSSLITESSSPDVNAPPVHTIVNPPAIAMNPPTLSTPPGVVAPTVPPFNRNGPLHLLGVPRLHLASHNGFVYEVPEPDALGPFYLMTRGTRVEVFSGWNVTSPHVIGVSHASFARVPTLAGGLTQLIQAINNGVTMWLA